MTHVKLTVTDGIADLVLDRPKVNALSRDLLQELGTAFQRASEDPAIRGVLLRSEGKCFSAGLDLREVGTYGRDELADFFNVFDAFLRPVFTCPKPVAAAVSGHAIAGGLVLALCADFLALGLGDYKLGLTELLVGVPFPREAFEAVRSALPPRAVRRFVYSAELLGPREAFDLGVGDVLVEDPEMAARFWLTMVCARPLETFAIAKRQMRAPSLAYMDAAPPSEKDEALRAIFSEDVRRALKGALR